MSKEGTHVGIHIIRRASVEVTGSVKADAFRFQQEVIVWTHDHLLPELDRIFASLPATEDSVYIDRLEIDLNASDIGNWGNEVLGKLKSELLPVLMNRAHSEKAARKREAKAERASAGWSFFQKLAYYLETGALPWSLAVASQSALHEEMQRWLTSSEIAGLGPQIAQLLQTGNARARFLASFSQAIVWKTLTAFFGVPEKAWENLYLDSESLRLAGRHMSIEGLEYLSPESEPVRLPEARTRNLLWAPPEPLSIPPILLREFVDALAANSFVYSERIEFEVAKSFLTRLVQERQIPAGDLNRLRFHSESFQAAREAVLKAGAESVAEPKSVPPEPPTIAITGSPLASGHLTSAVAASAEERRGLKRENPAVEGIFIQNAGLILLAPFLPTLFERTGLASGGQLKDPAMAMTLMHYLACGGEGPAEFQVILPKVLCGWEIEEHIDLPRMVPEPMKSEARQLLESAVAHWSILKNTSPEGLQEAFLSRSGKISLTEKNDWLLQVEQKSFDLLIQHLPWSFKLVKLSWMTRLLRTEWVD